MHTADSIITALLIISSLAGLYASGSFAWSSIQQKRGKGKPVEVTCSDGSCLILEKTAAGRLLGFPNWWLGLPFYLATLLATMFTNPTFVGLMMLASVAAVAMSMILIYHLLVTLKAKCTLCYVSHAANAVIFITWVTAIFLATK